MATMDVYGYNLNGGQMSSAAIWINNDERDWKQDLDAITVGWLVFPSHFKDSQTHLFTHWTRDDGRSTGCLNMDCPGFQLVSGSTVTPGDIIKPVSDVNGVHQNITIKLFKDKSSGDWLLHYGFNSAPAVVGHFPASLFDSLSKKATDIMFGAMSAMRRGFHLLQWAVEHSHRIRPRHFGIFNSSMRTGTASRSRMICPA
ncbi:hypothetical protein QOZ80_2BG0170480 [Eleusine coracana subsp. coracana]|nr:hypothetical protein QOZ80_2BG0170480 [Eleusine coracana subsp. coracana]